MGRNPTRIAAALAALAVSIMGLLGAEGAASAAMWGKDYFPNLPLVTQDGKTVRFYDDLIEGKIVVINFIYTTCPDICPLMTARMARVQDRLGDRVGRDIFIYSISLDPERDTPAALKKYAEAYGAGPGWLFLTGKPDDVALIRYKLGERSRNLSEHQSTIMLGNARSGEWARSSLFLDLERLVAEIRDMDPDWRARTRTRPAKGYAEAGPAQIGGQPGQALFLKACASCHSIGRGDMVGPDLKGVAARRDRAWLTRFMMAPDRLRATQDPVALALAARYEGAMMPNLGLSEVDVADLLAYLETQTKRLGEISHKEATQ